MGFNTQIMLCNDQMSSIEKDPEGFVRELMSRLNNPNSSLYGRFGMTVIPTAHADSPRLLFSHQNLMTELGYGTYKYGSQTQREIMKERVKSAKSMLKDMERWMKQIDEQEKENES